MRVAMKWSALAAVLAVGVVACGDDGGPGGGDLSTEEKSVLANALAQTPDSVGISLFASSIVQLVENVGKLDPGTQAQVRRILGDDMRLSVSGTSAATYDGVGFAMEYDYNVGGQSFSGFFLGVVGWSGLTASGVAELVMVGGFGEGSTLPSSASGTIEAGDVFAIYVSGQTAYVGIAGSASATPDFGGGSTDCSGNVEGITYDCSFTHGTMAGDFEFTAETASAASYTQSPISFTGLPSLRISIFYSDQ
jgi:hypothetical protein